MDLPDLTPESQELVAKAVSLGLTVAFELYRGRPIWVLMLADLPAQFDCNKEVSWEGSTIREAFQEYDRSPL